jgi:hypothetical protein
VAPSSPEPTDLPQLHAEAAELDAKLAVLRASMADALAYQRVLVALQGELEARTHGEGSTVGPYRDPGAGRAALLAAIDELRPHTLSLPHLRRRETALMVERHALGARIDRAGGRRSLPLLAHAAIVVPCSVPWDRMEGDGLVRFCRGCERSVFDLASMRPEEAERTLLEHGGNVCGRLAMRPDGTAVAGSACPSAPRPASDRLRAALSAAAAVGAVAGALGVAYAFHAARPLPAQPPLPSAHERTARLLPFTPGRIPQEKDFFPPDPNEPSETEDDQGPEDGQTLESSGVLGHMGWRPPPPK